MAIHGQSPTKARVAPAPEISQALAGALQRKCACGRAPGPSGECTACRRKRGLGRKELPLQSKLSVNQPGDQWEREADRVAGQIVRMPEPDRPCDEKRGSDKSAQCTIGVQRTLTAGVGSQVEAPPMVHDVLRSPGQPLTQATRTFMERRFGHDFSKVRVHTDARAAEMARSVQALAFTVGHSVVFGSGQYAPDQGRGKALLAHELVHVIQQSEAPSAATTLYRRATPWPFNGRVLNESAEPVTVWSDDDGVYTIPAGSASAYWTEDVDHIQDQYGNWYKIGPNTVTVDANGTVRGYQCSVFTYGEDCPPEIEGQPGDFPLPPGETRPA